MWAPSMFGGHETVTLSFFSLWDLGELHPTAMLSQHLLHASNVPPMTLHLLFCLPSMILGAFKIKKGNFLVVQWLRTQSPNAGELGLIPGQGPRSHMAQLKILHATTKTS